jgi:carboxypeptidase C (cathepsin A)
MRVLQISLLCLIATLGLTYGARDIDEFKSLPIAGDMPSKSYSGYLRTNSPFRRLHYIFVESLSNPKDDPVLIWFNGGPGCSSMLGFIQEIGPFKIDDYTDVIDKNPEPWIKRANVLFLENPAGTGFTLAKMPEDLDYLNDHMVSVDVFTALRDFFDNWPEYLPNPLWVTGESYAGIYGPYLAFQIHTWNQEIAAKRASR